ncbi:endonuclease/exonuclease/phosphatase family protein [Krasilnikovia sp. MM14-A1004]|uniref:endonuclease/exonuclease/phosphatase family protein n=1 Tax=Krasilnikovia sp. MM14-A1004 TaxID=3373541 RepID=UPI00399D3402
MRVMTFNIRHGQGADGRVDLARIGEVIRAADADVVGLQEVDRRFQARSRFRDQAGWLGRRLTMHVAYGGNRERRPRIPGAGRRQFGNAILSAYPIVDHENIALPRSGTREQRGLLRAGIDIGGVIWQVYATHLQHDDPGERLAQARAIRRILGAPEHTIVLADLNAQPTTPEVRALTDVLVDGWAAAGTGPGHTSASPAPTQRIDYVLHSPDVRSRSVVVLASPPAGIASDHLPVVADVAVDRVE